MKIKCSSRITASTDKLVGIIQSWVRMIDNYKNSGEKYPESVISDLYSSMKYVLKQHGGSVNANTSIRAGYAPADILWVLDEDNTWKTWGSAGPRIKSMTEDELLESLNSNGNNYIDVLITKNGENPDDYGRTEAIKDPFVKASTRTSSRRPIKAATDEYMLSEVLGDRESYIQEWQEASDGEPNTSWDNIFDNVVNDFELYCGDEASALGTDLPITERFNRGLLNERDIATEFADWVQWIDLSDYDY